MVKNSHKMKTIVLFGATGSVGVYTAVYLRSLGYGIIAVGHRKSDNGFFADYGIPYISMDISSKENFSKLPQKEIHTVINFAGAMPAHMPVCDPYKYVNTIVLGTLNILEYMKCVNCDKIIFSQSIADVLYLYGSTTPIKDDVERRNPQIGDHAIYSISKNAAVNLIEHYHAQYGIKRFILRLSTIYMYHPNKYYYVDGVKQEMGFRILIDKAMAGDPIEIWGDPNSKKQIVYVKDFIQIVEKCVISDCEGGVYNVGTGVGITMEDQVRGMIDVFSPVNNKSIIIYKPEKQGSPQFILDITKSQKELGYYPKWDYLSYLEDFKKEMHENPFEKLWGQSNDY